MKTRHTIHVEFYGIPRQRTGVGSVEIDVLSEEWRLGDLLHELTRRFPALERDCLDQTGLRPDCRANVGGERFIADPDARLRAGDSLLIMSADAGG